jgi:hypothetical protein
MKNFFILLLLAATTGANAQQAPPTEKSTDDLRARQELLHQQLRALQDSLQQLEEQLLEQGMRIDGDYLYRHRDGDFYFYSPRRNENDYSYRFYDRRPLDEESEIEIPPFPELRKLKELRRLDELEGREHGEPFFGRPPKDFYFEMPELDFRFEMPQPELYFEPPYHFEYRLPEIPRAPGHDDFYEYHYDKKKKRDDLLRMLPFYDFFKS